MGEMDQGFKDLLVEVIRLMARALEEKMEDEKFQEELIDINQRILKDYGRTIDVMAIALQITTLPVPSGKEKGEKPKLSLKFQFGDSKEDREMEREFGLDEREMNRLLEQARKERAGRGNIAPAGAEAASRPPAETEEAAEFDPRSTSQIINSVREIARALNFNQRLLLVSIVSMTNTGKAGGLDSVTVEQLQDDTAWLRSVQGLIDGAQKGGRSKGLIRKALLVLEGVFRKTGMLML